MALLLAGCGDTATDSVAADASSGATSSAATTVQWWSWNPNTEAAVGFVDAFEASHPDIDIEHRYIAYSDYPNTLRLALTSGEGPDVYGLQVGTLTQSFAPLAEDLAPYAADSLGDDWQDQLLEADQLVVDDKQVALPWMITGAGLLWQNATLLEEAGVETPTTLAELSAACATLAAQELECIAHGGKDAWVNLDVFQALVNDYEPGAMYDAIAGDTSWTDPAFVSAMQTWKQLFDEGIMQEGALGLAQYPDANDAFNSGGAGFIALGSWNSTQMTNAGLAAVAETAADPALADFEMLPISFPDVSGDGEPSPMFGGPDVGWAMAADSEEKDAAYTFIDWLTSQPEGQGLMGATLQQPALASEGVDGSDLAFPSQEAALTDVSDKLNNLVGARQLPNPELETALGDALAAVASGTRSPEEALEDVQSVSDSLSS